MHITPSRTGKLLFSLGLALVLAGCGGGGGGGSAAGGAGTGALSLGITDAPVDDLYQVWVTFTAVIIQPADGGERITVDVTDASGNGKMIELKSLGQGNSEMLLDEYPLPAGNYSGMRLVIDPDPAKTYVIVEEGGAQLAVDCSSCDESHLKLNRSFSIEEQGWIAFTIDFDLRKSITLRQRNKPDPQDFDYKLRPTLRIMDAKLASSYLYGTVTDSRSVQAEPANPAECIVYVYQGGADVVDPDDICTDPDPTVCPEADRPLTEAEVALNLDSGMYEYRTGYLYPDVYTVALVCGDDDPLVDEDLVFIGEDTVDASVAGGAAHDFELVDPI